MGKNNFITVEKKDCGYRIVLGNVNGKKIQSRQLFTDKADAVFSALSVAIKNNVRFVAG